MQLRDIKKILIIRLSSLGDLLLTTPLIRSIINKYPHLEIDFITRYEFSDALKYNPNLSNLFSYNKNGENKKLFEDLIGRNYDLIIDLQNNNRSAGIVQSLSRPVAKFHKPNVKKFLLVNFKINMFKQLLSIPERYADAVKEVELDDEGLELFVPDKIKSRISKDKRHVGFCPGSKHFTKMWPEQYFIDLGNKLKAEGKKIILFGGKDDKKICTNISSQIKDSIDLSGEDDLLQIAADMKNCEYIICNDSGLMHTACAADIPVVVLFGSTVIEFGFFPYKAQSLVLENNSLSCRPCSHIGKKSCPKKHFKCMKDLSPSFVHEKLKNFTINL